MRIDTILWDWNGTLLNDTEICIQVMNAMLKKRNKPLLSPKHYQEVFTFPVSEYYQRIGWDFRVEPFEEIGLEFIKEYTERLPEAELFPEAKEILRAINSSGVQQHILSAMEKNSLVKSVEKRGIASYFDCIHGIDNHYAGGKKELAANLMARGFFHAGGTLIIGDTLHDADIAGFLHTQCLLVANGHQSHSRLSTSKYKVISNLYAIRDLIAYLPGEITFSLV
ncbi:MAG TPA: HAD hydrolase-like protein [Bacteroidales bacterium]|nr:HAD hydrolase-like protein [Bacteroidales bacterium]